MDRIKHQLKYRSTHWPERGIERPLFYFRSRGTAGNGAQSVLYSVSGHVYSWTSGATISVSGFRLAPNQAMFAAAAIVATPFPFPVQKASVAQFCFRFRCANRPRSAAHAQSRDAFAYVQTQRSRPGSAYLLAVSRRFSNCHPTLRGGPRGSLADRGDSPAPQYRNPQLQKEQFNAAQSMGFARGWRSTRVKYRTEGSVVRQLLLQIQIDLVAQLTNI